MTRLGRFGIAALGVVCLYLLGTLVHQVGSLNNKLGNAQGQIAEKDRQLRIRDATITTQNGALAAAAIRDGQYVAIITTLTRQLERAGLQPVVRPEDVPSPQPGPPVTTPRPPTASPRPSSKPTPRPTGKPSPSPSPGPPCTVRNPLPTGPRCLVPPGRERDPDTLNRALALLLAALQPS